MRYLLYTVESADVVKCINTWGETSVKTENLIVDESCEREVVEEIGEVLPYVGIAILSETFIVEAVHLSNLTRLVVTTEDGDALRISDLESNEQRDCFDGVIASIDVVSCNECQHELSLCGKVQTHEEVISVWVWPSNSKKLHQIVELTVYISTDCDRAFLIPC